MAFWTSPDDSILSIAVIGPSGQPRCDSCCREPAEHWVLEKFRVDGRLRGYCWDVCGTCLARAEKLLRDRGKAAS
jgi:hypothetical protein